MINRVYELLYYGYQTVNNLSSDSLLQWTSKELFYKTDPIKVNIVIHNKAINILAERGCITAIPFSYQSPFSVGRTRKLLYLTELAHKPNTIKCHVFCTETEEQAEQVNDEVRLLKDNALEATQRNLDRQGSTTARLKRSHSAENLISPTLHIPDDKSRRQSVDPSLVKSRENERRQRRKSTPVRTSDIFEVEYIGVAPAPESQIPDIDETVRLIQRKVDQGRQDNSKPHTGLLHIGQKEVQLLHIDYTVIKRWTITQIKACSQGCNREYFGWSCREEPAKGQEQCYVHIFRANTANQGVSIIQTLHKVCMSAYDKFKPSLDSCKYCPVIIFNNICDRLMGLDEDNVAKELDKVISTLSERDCMEVLKTFKTEDRDINIKNNFLIGCLRSIYEKQQEYHVHNTPYQPPQTSPKVPRKQVEIKRPLGSLTPNPNRRGSLFTGLFGSKENNRETDSDSDTDVKKKQSRRQRSSTEIALYDSKPLTMANDRRALRRQKSCRMAIYDSVHTAHRDGILSKHNRHDSTDSLASILSTVEHDVIDERKKELDEIWDKIFKRQNDANKIEDHFKKDVESAVFQGVPENKRGRVWQLLASMRKSPSPVPKPEATYEDLYTCASNCKAAIMLDIGRTFPKHHYFQEPQGEGQTKLCNMLLAYSGYDVEVGYCQGMSFIAGILLVYLEEEEAFNLFVNLLRKYDLRDNYKPDMCGLKMRLYQLTRLVHDRFYSVHEHLNTYEVTPHLYAVSWLMTSFATQLPLNTAARVMDFVFLQGIDAIFKIIIFVLQMSQEEILELKTFETLTKFMTDTIPQKIAASFEYHTSEIFSVDISTDLRDLQIEYKVLHEDVSNANKTEFLETKYNLLREQNKAHTTQIAQLNRELQKTRSEKRALVERLDDANVVVSHLEEENERLRYELAALRNATLELHYVGNSGNNAGIADPLQLAGFG